MSCETVLFIELYQIVEVFLTFLGGGRYARAFLIHALQVLLLKFYPLIGELEFQV